MQNIKKNLKQNWESYILNIFVFSFFLFLVWLFFFSDVFKNFLLSLEVFFQTQKEYAYLVAFFMAIAEGTILLGVVPGTSYTVTAGVFWARGDIDPFLLFPIVIFGAFLGDCLGYFLGSLSSNFVKGKVGENPNYKMAKDFIDKHGGKAVFLARFVNGIKELVPFIAGNLKMDLKKFMFWNFLGAIGWSVLYISLGYFLGEYVKDIESITKTVGVIILSILSVSVFFLYKKGVFKNLS